MLSLHENHDVGKNFVRKMATLWEMGDAEPQLSGKQVQYPYLSMKSDGKQRHDTHSALNTG